jgi:flagellin-like protein
VLVSKISRLCQRRKRAVSPVVATVLLIAITVAAAAMVWFVVMPMISGSAEPVIQSVTPEDGDDNGSYELLDVRVRNFGTAEFKVDDASVNPTGGTSEDWSVLSGGTIEQGTSGTVSLQAPDDGLAAGTSFTVTLESSDTSCSSETINLPAGTSGDWVLYDLAGTYYIADILWLGAFDNGGNKFCSQHGDGTALGDEVDREHLATIAPAQFDTYFGDTTYGNEHFEFDDVDYEWRHLTWSSAVQHRSVNYGFNWEDIYHTVGVGNGGDNDVNNHYSFAWFALKNEGASSTTFNLRLGSDDAFIFWYGESGAAVGTVDDSFSHFGHRGFSGFQNSDSVTMGAGETWCFLLAVDDGHGPSGFVIGVDDPTGLTVALPTGY